MGTEFGLCTASKVTWLHATLIGLLLLLATIICVQNQDSEFTTHISYLEVYNDVGRDLLTAGDVRGIDDLRLVGAYAFNIKLSLDNSSE